MNSTTILKPQYKFAIFFATLYMATNLCIPILSNKLIGMPFITVSAASFISPFWFLLGDIIAETYGFTMIMRFFWSLVASEVLFDIFCYGLINLPSPSGWLGQSSYNAILGPLLYLNIWSVLAITVAWRINAYLLLKWKALTGGKYFWLRSVGSSAIGETLFTLLMSPALLVFGPANHWREAMYFFTVTWSFRVIGTAIFAVPGSFVVRILKIIEKIDIYEQQFSINPFKKTTKS